MTPVTDRRRRRFSEDQAFRATAAVTGLAALVAAAMALDLARAHSVFSQAVCGVGAVPHCGWCFTAAGLSLASLGAFGAAVSPAGATRKPR
jgi:hypothetical protein